MELRQLATFRAAAAALNFTRAAATLGYAQSSVTAQIQALEADLGVQLFDRLGRRVALTEEGQNLLPYAERLLALAGEARAAVADDEEPSGTLAVGAPETLCAYRLPALLEHFLARCPRVRLVVRPLPLAEVRPRLGEGAVDVAFLMAEPFAAAGLAVEPLVAEPVLVLAAPGHPLAGLARVRPADLANTPVLLTETGCGYRTLFLRALAAASVQPASSVEFASVEAIKQCAMAGLGIAVLPAVAVAPEVAQGRLCALAWTAPDLHVVTQVAWREKRWLSPALRTFLDVSRQVLAPAGSRAPEQPAAPRQR